MTDESHHKPHFTTRRGFIAAAGFGVVGLYFLWAGYGAAPLNIFSGSAESEAPAGGGHGGGHGAAAGPSVEEFRSAAESFIEANKLPDGSVMPRRQAMAEATSVEQMDHAAMGHGPQAEAGPTDVYLMAYQWGYQPAVLRLEANVPYRFRMMALDMTHGASLQLGAGSRIVRLRPGAVAEQTFTFTKPGEYLLYCTVYCGMGHDRMQGKIIVTVPQEGSGSHETADAH